MVANFIKTFFLAMGDFTILDSSMFVPAGTESALFFIAFSILVIITCIIMLNFVIAQASATYENINETLNETIIKDLAGLCAEADALSI